MNKKLNIILSGTTLSESNRGVNALTIGSLIALIGNNPNIHIELFNQNSHDDMIIKHKIKISGKEYEITENYVWSSKYILCGILHLIFFFLPLKIKKYLFIDKLRLFYQLPVAVKKNWKNKKILKDNPGLKKLISADYVITLSEGDSFSDIYGLHVTLRHSLDKILAGIYNTKFILFPQTIGPFNTFIGKYLSSKIIRDAQKIYIREKQSKMHLIELFGDIPNIEEANDMAFLMEPEKIDNKEFDWFLKNSINIGVNLSGFLYSDQYGISKINKNINYIKLSEKIIRSLLDINNKVKIILISHVGLEDYIVCKILFNKIANPKYKNRLLLLDHKYTAPQLKYFISQLDFFTGSRMHACIAAFSTAVAAVPQAYSYKFLGITDKLDLGKYVIDLRADTADSILNTVLSGFENRRKIKDHLLKILPKIKSEAFKCGKIE